MDEILKFYRTIQIKETEQNFPVVLFIMSTVQGGPIFLFVDDFLKCYHSDEGY